MGLPCFLASLLLLATSSFARRQEAEQGLNRSTLHLTLYHVFGPESPLTSHSPPSISELLSRDKARVKHLNSRLTKINRTSSVANSTSHNSEHLFGPLNLGLPIGIGTGNYYINVGLGTPPTYYHVIVDTGSSLSWLQCQSCPGCNEQVRPFFDPPSSSTFKLVPCTTPECNALKDVTPNGPNCISLNTCLYNATYGDDSFSSGYLIQDSLTLTQSETLTGFVCGCGQHSEGFSIEFAGLFGLARNELSMLSQLSAKYGNAFSYCLPSASGTSGGSLSIGTDSLMESSYKFTPMITSKDNSLYYLNLIEIVVAGRTMAVPTDHLMVIDSGTEVTRIPMSLYIDLVYVVTEIMVLANHETAGNFDIFHMCYQGSVKNMQSDVPEIRLVFQGGADLTLEPQSLLIDVPELGITCFTFAPNVFDDDFAIIGNIHQRTYRVAYDVHNSRIGFAAGACS
ncbi:aspartyl protease family protein At5g10770-like [Cornus florida]|uniref:aspartyl protease family protein At5g10770-like n=1 Tax=Cornus florida TaxID=4283 RepID=UPI00289B6938|nr:aspartyl protease family protein At5g10770-like [Cornus florida]